MNMNDRASTPYYRIIDEYLEESGITALDVRVIVTNDLESAFYTVRPDQRGKDTANNDEYNGFFVSPATLDGQFAILLKKDYVKKSKERRDFNWVGTVVHETTHADDYRKYRQMVSAQTYDELFDRNAHRSFNFWTEYHARIMGEEFVMKYRNENKSPYAELDTIIDEFEKHAETYNNSNDNGERLLEYEAALLGMLRVREKYFPETFSYENLLEAESMRKLYCFLMDHETIEQAEPHFQQLYDLLKGVHPYMP